MHVVDKEGGKMKIDHGSDPCHIICEAEVRTEKQQD